MLVLADLALPLLLSIGSPQSQQSSGQPADLNDATYPVFRASIEARQPELGWEDLPWLPTYYEGLVKAGEEQKPLLLWAMNGHPLGCT